MPFPWGQPAVDLSFTCKHCGQTYRNEYNTVALCSCPAAEQERLEQHERDVTFQRQQKVDPQVSFQEARERNKARSKPQP